MKARTNVSVDKELLETARKHGLQLSRILEDALRLRIADEAAARWREENRERIRDYASTIDEHGVLGDEFRDF
ncbi:MAG: type II toxin-antitoxin system CcdA family antitoxin [Spirochaeta sp.]|jgi:antitoxin CcdA|nr:type II toxin-antitoxin system CcdA family antitoxin [Spirochaeta sp.]